MTLSLSSQLDFFLSTPLYILSRTFIPVPQFHKPLNNKETANRLRCMATLERAKVFRRQGSSGPVWDEKLLFGDDKIEYRELRPCQSGSNIRTMDCSSSIAAPISCPRSLSTPGTMITYSDDLEKHVFPKSKSGKRNLILGILDGNK